MSYSKHHHVDKAMEVFNLVVAGDMAKLGMMANLVIPFAAFVAKKKGLELSLSISELLSGDDIPAALKEFMSGDGAGWASCSLSSFEKVSPEEIKDFIKEKISAWKEKLCEDGDVIIFPFSLNELCARVLDLKSGNLLVDFGSGFCSFLIHAAKNFRCRKLVGIEIDRTVWTLGSILYYLEDVELDLKLCDVLAFVSDCKYDKIFSFPPFDIDLGAFFKKVKELLSDNGRAAIVLPKSFLLNEGQGVGECRRMLLEEGLVQSVVEFASGVLYPYSGVQIALIVLSRGNQSVHFVDASCVYEDTRRGASVLTDDGAKEIFGMLGEENERSRLISYDEIKSRGCLLAPSSYLMEERIGMRGVDEYVPLSNLVESKIMRGAQIKASELESLTSAEDTGICYAFAKDIRDNQLSDRLKFLKSLDGKIKSLALKDGDLLLVMALTENLKVACVEKVGNKTIIPASNIYIIRPDKTKLVPLYLKMILESKEAARVFNAFSSGSVLRSISIDLLNRLQIPLPPMEVQKGLAEKYRKIEDECGLLKERLDALTSQKGEVLSTLF